jgi:ATP-binding cassette subfamily B protein
MTKATDVAPEPEITPKQALLLALRLIVKSSPQELTSLTCLSVLYGAGPIVILYIGKIVIDIVTELTTLGGSGFDFQQLTNQPLLLWSVCGFIVLNFILDAIQTLVGLQQDNLRDNLIGAVKTKLIEKVSYFADISLFEQPKLLNKLQLAEQGVERIPQVVGSMGGLLAGIFAFVPALLLSFAIAWWVPVVLFITALPAIIKHGRVEEQSWSAEFLQAENVRYRNLIEHILTNEIYAKELRLYNAQKHFQIQWNTLYRKTFEVLRSVRAKGVLTVIGWSTLSALGAGIPYVFVILEAIAGQYTLGDLALYAGLIFQVRRSLGLLIYDGADIYQAALGISPIFQILALQPQLQHCADEVNVIPKVTVPELRVSHVNFIYPGGDVPVLNDIDLTLSAGQMTVIVGENGSGKTTLAKLLCRFYDPTSGFIQYNSHDVRSFDLADYRSEIAAVFQDYAQFPATLRENIAIGNIMQLEDDENLFKAIAYAGLTDITDRLSGGLDTFLGKSIEGGDELSGGQWQRIALSRAILRLKQAKLVILDEPTSALDPNTEHEILSLLQAIARGKIAVIISHRLSLARAADQIVVMHKGYIVETGTHTELMSKPGFYYKMFNNQASSYA